MEENIKLLNVKLPFIEAIEFLKTDNDVIGCMCVGSERPCIIALNETNELQIIENNLFNKKSDAPFNDRLLCLDDVLEKEWFLIIKKLVDIK